jgi:DNA-binding response OmpR family regulator/drug/metabolite transporter (DMT)-like permease
MKLTKAVSNLGHNPESAEDGARGLERLRAGGIDLLLLDIEMPVMDGFEVLERLKADPKLREVPTLVISGIDEIHKAAKAIELGAVDFLPKTFNAVLLTARVNACLERAGHRARELETLAQIERLTAAANALDSDDMNPMELEVRDIAMRPGALGNLSRVLLNKSTMVYNRRQAQAQQIRNLFGALMLLVLGATFGLKPALARLYLADVGNPLSVGLYTMGLTTVMIACYAIATKIQWPRLSPKTFGFCLILALLTLAPQVLLFWVAEEVPGVIIAILVSLESFIVFFVATMSGMERMSLRRLFGLVLGVSGVLVLLLPQFNVGPGAIAIAWLVLAMCIPACFAGESILLALAKSFDLDVIAATVIIFCMSTVILLIAVGTTVGFVPLQFPLEGFEMTVIAFSCADTIATITFVNLIRYAGPVFTSQKAYTVAIGGVAWSVLLLREDISVTSAVALAFILAGLYFVAKKSVVEKLLKPYPAV